RGKGAAPNWSPGLLKAMTSSMSAASDTERVIGPAVATPIRSRERGACEILPRLGLSPKTPQADAGMRRDPPGRLPWATGARAAATAAAAPPLEPPGVRVVWQGLRVAGTRSFSV